MPFFTQKPAKGLSLNGYFDLAASRGPASDSDCQISFLVMSVDSRLSTQSLQSLLRQLGENALDGMDLRTAALLPAACRRLFVNLRKRIVNQLTELAIAENGLRISLLFAYYKRELGAQLPKLTLEILNSHSTFQ